MEAGKTYKKVVDRKAVIEEILKYPWINCISYLLQVHSLFWLKNWGLDETPLEEEFKKIRTWVISDIAISISWIIAGYFEDEYSPLVRKNFLNSVHFAASICMVCTSFSLACHRSAKRLKHATRDSKETGDVSSDESCPWFSDEETSEDQENTSDSETELPWKILHVTEFARENMTQNLQENKFLTYADVENICENLELLCRKQEKMIMKTLFGEKTSAEENSDGSVPESVFSKNDDAVEKEHVQGKGNSDSATGSQQLSPDESLQNWIRNAHEIFSYNDIAQEAASRRKRLRRYVYSKMTNSEYLERSAKPLELKVGEQSSSLQKDRAAAPDSIESAASAGTSRAAGDEVGSSNSRTPEEVPALGSHVQTESKRSIHISTYEEQETKTNTDNSDHSNAGCSQYSDGTNTSARATRSEKSDKKAGSKDDWKKSASYPIVVVDNQIDGMVHLVLGVPAKKSKDSSNIEAPRGMKLLVLMCNRAAESWERISDVRFSAPLPMSDSTKADVKSIFHLLYSSLKALKCAASRNKSIGPDIRLWHLLHGIYHYTTPGHSSRSSPGPSSSRLPAGEDPENPGKSGTASLGRSSTSRKYYSRRLGKKRQHTSTDESTTDTETRRRSHVPKRVSKVSAERSHPTTRSAQLAHQEKYALKQEELRGSYSHTEDANMASTNSDPSPPHTSAMEQDDLVPRYPVDHDDHPQGYSSHKYLEQPGFTACPPTEEHYFSSDSSQMDESYKTDSPYAESYYADHSSSES